MPPLLPAPIAIVGGGPGGLMLARLLQTVGIDYVVFERDSSPTPTSRFLGGTLDIHGATGQAALRRAGLKSQFEQLARRHATTMVLQDFRGENRRTIGEDRDAPEIDRLQLRQLLLDSIPAERIRWGKKLLAAERDESQQSSSATNVLLHFADGSIESGFRLIVGADGSRSNVRPLITPAKPRYVGKMFIEGRLSFNNPQHGAALRMAGAGSLLATSGKNALVVQQMSDRTYRVYMGLQAPETLTRAGGAVDLEFTEKARATVLNWFYQDWNPSLRAFVEDSEGPWRAWPWYRLDPELLLPTSASKSNETQTTWTRSPGVVLLGDAAHLATPNGEGVNVAMQDAMVLFERIVAELGVDTHRESRYSIEDDSAAVERACVSYEADMRPRGRKTIEASMMMEEMFFAEDGIERMIEITGGDEE